MILADKIITLRKKNGWSQEELAEHLGVSRQAVSKWEGAQSTPDLERVLKMAQLFGVSTDYLLKDEMEESEPAAASCSDVYADSPIRTVSMEEANAFLKAKEQTTGRIALGAFLCTFAPVPLLLLTGISTFTELSLSSEAACLLGLVLLFAAVACALLLFFSCRRYTEPFDYLETELIDTAYGVSGMVRQEKQKNAAAHARLAVCGTLAGLLSPLPLLATAPFGNAPDAERRRSVRDHSDGRSVCGAVYSAGRSPGKLGQAAGGGRLYPRPQNFAHPAGGHLHRFLAAGYRHLSGLELPDQQLGAQLGRVACGGRAVCRSVGDPRQPDRQKAQVILSPAGEPLPAAGEFSKTFFHNESRASGKNAGGS